jgi:hypothetical protein
MVLGVKVPLSRKASLAALLLLAAVIVVEYTITALRIMAVYHEF